VCADGNERHRGILKKGLHKEFLDEIVPLSCFAVLNYPDDYRICPILGNQGYDAVVLNESDIEVGRIEMTSPHDGAEDAKDARLIVERGFGSLDTGDPGDDFERLIPYVLDTCRKKALKDYSDCTLVVAIQPLKWPFGGVEGRYEDQVSTLVSEIEQIEFKAKEVFLLLLPDRHIKIKG